MRWFAPLLLTALSLTACSPTTQVDPPPGDGCETTGCTTGRHCNLGTHQCELDAVLGDCSPACAADQACQSSTCVACRTDRVCTGNFTACGAGTSTCTECRANTCGGAFPLCDAENGCSQCLADADCSVGAPYCDGLHCVQCRSDSECSGGEICRGGACTVACSYGTPCPSARPFCSSSTDYCTQCRDDEDCPSGEACYSGTCRAALKGDACSNAQALALSDTPIVLDGTTDRYADNRLWYAVTVDRDSLLTLDLQADLYATHEVALYAACDQPSYLLERDEKQIKDRFVSAGVYWVSVSSRVDFSPGWFTITRNFVLTLSRTPASRQQGNDCSKAIRLDVGGAGGQETSVTGDTTGLQTLPHDGCGSAGDVAYGFTLAENSLVKATLTPARPDVDLALQLHSGTCYELLYCGLAAPGAPVTQTLKDVPPGEMSLIVQTHNWEGPYALDVLTRPYPANNACYKAQPLQFANGVAVVSSDTTDVTPTTAGCDYYREVPAVHYTLSTVGMGERSLRLDFLSQETGTGEISITSACRTSSSGPPDVCGDVMVDNPRLPEGVYQVQVAKAGHFTMRATLGPPIAAPANDTCASPAELSLSGNTFGPISGDTRGATSDMAYACGSGNQYDRPGRDVVYHLAVPGRGRLTTTLTPLDAGFDPTLQLGSTCTGYDVGCGKTALSGAAETASGRVSTDAYLWVDSENQTEGPFELSGSFTPAPANDLCVNATPIANGANVSGTISTAFFDSTACSSTSSNVNLFYTYTAPANGQVTVTLTPSGFDGQLVRLVGGCGATSCGAAIDNGGVDGVETMGFAAARNTVYVFAVEGRTGLDPDPEGTFTLTLTGP